MSVKITRDVEEQCKIVFLFFFLVGFSRDDSEKIKLKLTTLTLTYFHAQRVQNLDVSRCERR